LSPTFGASIQVFLLRLSKRDMGQVQTLVTFDRSPSRQGKLLRSLNTNQVAALESSMTKAAFCFQQ